MKRNKASVILIMMFFSALALSKVFVYGGLPVSSSENNLKEYSSTLIKGIASLVRIENGQVRHFCTASFLDQQHIVTAAHCIVGVRFSKLKKIHIAYGENQYTDGITLSKVKIHHSFFSENNSPDDIAIIQLSKKVPFKVKPFKIASFKTSLSKLIFSGYGKTHLNDIPFNRVLNSARGTILEEDDLNKLLTTSYSSFQTGMCSGDSGGPLLRINQENKLEIVGITHGTSGYQHDPIDDCADDKVKGVFTDIRYYQGWMECVLDRDLDINGVISQSCGGKLESLDLYLPKLVIYLKNSCERYSSEYYSLRYDSTDNICYPTSEASCEDYGGTWNDLNKACADWE